MSQRSIRQCGKDFKSADEEDAYLEQEEVLTLVEQLCAACRVGDLEATKRLIHRGVNPNKFPTRDWENTSPNAFCVACSCGHLDIVQYLVSCSKADPNYTEYGHPTALETACGHGHFSIVKLLVEKYHANVSQENSCYYDDSSSYTALDYACNSGHLDVVEYILEKGSFSKQRIQTILLNISGKEKGIPVIQRFLANGFDMNFADDNGVSPIYKSCVASCIPVTKFLLTQAHTDVRTIIKKWRSPLTAAIQSGNKTCIKLLIHTGKADVNEPDNAGDLPLVVACMSNNGALVQYLLNKNNAKIPERITKILGKRHCNPNIINYMFRLYTKKAQAPVITFLCSHHARCGKESILVIFPHEILLHIAKLALNKATLNM